MHVMPKTLKTFCVSADCGAGRHQRSVHRCSGEPHQRLLFAGGGVRARPREEGRQGVLQGRGGTQQQPRAARQL